jgi:type IV secretory pathway TraG/TraD family ATPase VirD4
VKFLVLDVHGGTTEDDILGIFEKALMFITSNQSESTTENTLSQPNNTEVLSRQSNPVYVFLDEVNTCAHMGLISEAIIMRSLHGRFIFLINFIVFYGGVILTFFFIILLSSLGAFMMTFIFWQL